MLMFQMKKKMNSKFKKIGFLLTFVVVSYNFCFSQNNQSSDSLLYERKSKKIKWYSVEDYRAAYTNKIILELNNWKTGDTLHNFLYDINLDSRQIGYWWGPHNPFSLRKYIFDYLVNVDLLELIISKESIFNSKPIKQGENDPPIPYNEFSNYELAKYRIEELKNLKPSYFSPH